MSVKSVILGLVVLVGMSSPVWAQSSATPASKLAWDQPGVASSAEAQAYTFKYYLDGSVTGTTLTGVTCSGVPPAVVSCLTTFPATTSGNHSLTLTSSNVAGESLKSTALPFVYVVVPSAPSNLRIQ